MNIDLSDQNLSQYEILEINNLLARKKEGLNDLDQMWYLMDLIWSDMGCDNKQLDWEKIGQFYSHPVWLLNGLFIEQHELSMQHRNSISDWVVNNKFQNVVDYGGGFGTLARLIATKDNAINVNVYEPHPSNFGVKRAAEHDNISLISHLNGQYDCLISTDVLEHVPDPLKNFSDMIDSVRTDGYLIIANAFFPMIKCHLPQTFHFRYSFSVFAKMMGLEKIGLLHDSHATIYKKTKSVKPNWHAVRSLEGLSRLSFPFLEALKIIVRLLRKALPK